ncbi:hypothetical protein O6H91_08G072400 [Diphasiastrum complanatum]|uniref:Uncharacterized protein n=1 Tax=Diphasiastrum complanatum TaxID=34168 RepID=A0ACC2CZU9_DIPCM|nr:hypothetical protein O6H91_08G072400 [Diphasiastrum complanatum]
MAENLKERLNALSGKLKEGGAEMSRKVSERVSSMTEKMKELLQVSSHADKLVLEATAEDLAMPDMNKNLEICDFIEHDHIGGQDVVKAIKRRLLSRSPVVQFLALSLLEACVNNCEIVYAEIASEKVLDEMVKIVDDPLAASSTRDKALRLIEAWGSSADELRYLPVFQETYKSLKSRGILFPVRESEIAAPIFKPQSASQVSVHSRTFAEVVGVQDGETTTEIFDVARNSLELLSTVLSSSPQQEVLQDELTLTLVEQCQHSQLKVQSIIESVGDNDALLFEALHINDELQQVFLKYEDMLMGVSPQSSQSKEPAIIKAQLADEKLVADEQENISVQKLHSEAAVTETLSRDNALKNLDEMIFQRDFASKR